MRGTVGGRLLPALAALGLLTTLPTASLTPVSDAHPTWTVTTDSEEPGSGAAANAIDGDPSTWWRTSYSTGEAPLPHWLLLDTGSVGPMAGVTLQPRQDGKAEGNIGQYRIEVSVNGRWWRTISSGILADSTGTKTVEFPLVRARYLRLTELSEAGSRGAMGSLAELGLLTTAPAAPAAGTGRWSLPFNLPLVPVSAAMLTTGKVLLWSSYKPDFYGYVGEEPKGTAKTFTALWDPTTTGITQATVVSTDHDMFCPGTALLGDGTLLINGGTSDTKTSLYDPKTGTWSIGTPMVYKRGYQAAVTTSAGSVFTLGGSWNDKAGGKDGEKWTAAGGSVALPGAAVAPILTHDSEGPYRQDNHAWLFAWAHGKVVHAGPSPAMHWYDTNGNGSVTGAGSRNSDADAMNGATAMYDIGKVLTVGGAPNYKDSVATNHAYTIDLNGTTASTTVNPTVTTVGPLAYPRAFATSVVLPDGTVLVVGGQAYAHPFSDATSQLSPELFNPATGAFTTLAPMQVPRNYHSFALLLPDARVLAGGGGLCGLNCPEGNHPDAEVFTPPYLLSSTGAALARPTLVKAPATADPGAVVSVTTNRAVSSFALVRMASVTHSVNNDQRRVPLTIVGASVTSKTGTTYGLRLPATDGVLIPGAYMLFALDAKGVPSVSKTVLVS